MKKNYNYDFLLPFYVANDELRPSMNHIHKHSDGYIYATDAHLLIRVPGDKVANDYKAVEKFPRADNIVSEALNRPDNKVFSIVVDDLIAVLSKAKWYKTTEGDECPDCKGNGEITCHACGHEHECDKCKGKGEINDRITEFSLLKEEDYFIVKIKNQCFRASLLHILAISAKVAGFETVEYVSDQKANSPALFKFEDNVIVLIMPCVGNGSNIELKTKIITK